MYQLPARLPAGLQAAQIGCAHLQAHRAPIAPPHLQVLYLASLIRSITALHDLIDNKQSRQWYEKQKVRQVGGVVGWVAAVICPCLLP